MKPRSLMARAGLVALCLAYPFAIVLGPRQGLGVLLAAALVTGNFALMRSRVGDAARLLGLPAAPGHRAVTARAMVSGAFRWLTTFLLLIGLLRLFHPLAVVAGLSCMVAAIALQACFDVLHTERDPSPGAGP